MRAVVEEGLLLGVVGAVIGLFGGIGLAPALDGLFKAFGADLPDNGTVLEARTVIVSLGVGIVVTVLAGFFPALRATRVPPIAAMREGVQIPPRPLPTRRTLIVRFVVGLVVIVSRSERSRAGMSCSRCWRSSWCLRAARLWARLRRDGERPPRHYRVVPALAGAIGWLVSWRGITARLARENSVRQPGRTLVTALALTVGLGLVAFISVLAAGTKATIDQRRQPLVRRQPDRPEHPGRRRASPRRWRRRSGRSTAWARSPRSPSRKGRVRDLAQPGAPVIDEEEPRDRDRTRIVREDVQDRMGTRLGGDARRARARRARSSRRSSRAPTTCTWGSACRC